MKSNNQNESAPSRLLGEHNVYDPSQERTWERETDGVHEKPDGDDEHTRSGGHVERAFEDPSAQEADHDEYDSEDQKEAFVHSVSDSSISNEQFY
jgi:hypothetical protein